MAQKQNSEKNTSEKKIGNSGSSQKTKNVVKTATKPTLYNPCNISALGVQDPKKGFAAKLGVPTKATTCDNDHHLGAESRGVGRFMLHATDDVWRLADPGLKTDPPRPTRASVVGYPSGFEEKLPDKLCHREALFDMDEVRGLKVHKLDMKRLAGKDVHLILNDVYICDFPRLLSIRNVARSLVILSSALSLAGDIGADVVNRRAATIWYKKNEVFTCFSPDAGSEYVHRDTRPWKGLKFVQYAGFDLTHKQEKIIGKSRILSTILVQPSTRILPTIPFRRASPGILVKQRSVPALNSVDWVLKQSGTDRDQISFPLIADQAVAQDFGDLLSHLNVDVGEDNLLTLYRKARTSTIEKHLDDGDLISIVDPNPIATQRERDFAKSASVLGPFSKLAATLRPKRPYMETVVRFSTELVELIKQLVSRLVKACKKLFVYLSGVSFDPLGDKGKEEESLLSPCHTLFHSQKLLFKLSKKLKQVSGGSKWFTGLNRASNCARWAANLMSKPFEAETFFPLIGEILLTIGVVAAERAIGSATSGISEIIICIVEVSNIMTSEASLPYRIITSLINILAHTFMALVPWWVSLPVHIIYDLVVTDVAFKALMKVWDYLDDRGLFSKELKASWRTFQGLWEKAKLAVHIHPDVAVEDGSIVFSDLTDGAFEVVPANSEDQAVVSLENIERFSKNEAVSLKFKVNGKGVALADLQSHFKSVKERPFARAYPMMDLPILRGFILTTPHPFTFFSAIIMRYHDVNPYEGDNFVISFLMDRLTEGMAPLYPMNWTDFQAHMRHAQWPAPKVNAYLEANRLKESDILDSKKEIGGKPNELLSWKPDDHLKSRAVLYYKPTQHMKHDSILWALKIKEIWCDYINSTTFRSEHKPYLQIFIPKTGSAAEIAQMLNDSEPGSIRCLAQGDDGYDCFTPIANSGKKQTLACDLKSCDTTLGPLIRPILRAFVAKGLSQLVADHILELCMGPFKFKNYQKGTRGETIKFSANLNIGILNGTGHPCTTVVTLAAATSHKLLSWQHWNGDPSHWKRSLGDSATLLGIKIEVEDHGFPGMNPMGRDTFLSCVPIMTPSGVVVIPKAHTKALVLKGEKNHFKGMTLLSSLAARAKDPSLSTTNYGRAIRRAFQRQLHGKPIPIGSSEPVNPYKITFDEITNPLLTLEEEAEYYSQFGPFTIDDLVGELLDWDLGDFPYKGGKFPILEAVSKAHYNLI